MTYDIPEIIEELYEQHVMIPDTSFPLFTFPPSA